LPFHEHGVCRCFRLSTVPTTVDHLLSKEVLDALNTDNKNLRFAGILEPSDGLEPSTPSLPWRLRSPAGDAETALGGALSLQSASFTAFSKFSLKDPEQP
jgi:hypothetical protein